MKEIKYKRTEMYSKTKVWLSLIEIDWCTERPLALLGEKLIFGTDFYRNKIDCCL